MIHRVTLTTDPHVRNLPGRVVAAIFDFDETMIDLEPQHSAASEALCRAMGSDYFSMPEEFRLGSGRRVIDDVRQLRAWFGWELLEDELLAIRQRAFDDACASADLELMPGVERVVAILRRDGIRMAITSSAVRSAIETILRRFDLRDFFELIIDGSEVERGKPDPAAYLLTAEKLGVSPRDCVVFEDSTVGVAAAKAAGMYCIAVRNPRALLRQELSAADVVVNSFEELLTSPSPSGR